MKRLLTASLALALLLPASALGQSPTRTHARQYERAYHAVAAKFGRRTPGRNIIRDGMAQRKTSDADVVRSLSILRRMLTPPPVYSPPVYSPPAAPTTATPAVTYGGGGGGLPACASESGTNYSTGSDNTNPSGATGRYQIMPGTAANYGCSLATPAGQDACAQVIYAHQGAGAWVGCGG